MEKIWSKEVFATMRFVASAEVKGKLKECVTAVGGVNSVKHCIVIMRGRVSTHTFRGEDVRM
jgi:hypothetical protein